MKQRYGFIIILVFLSVIVPVHAQETGHYILTPTGEGLVIQGIYTDGTAGPVITTLDDITIDEQYPLQWNVPVPFHMATSPDDNFLAFTAENQQEEYTLFVYDFTNEQLKHYSVTTMYQPNWSPDSQFILLDPRYIQDDLHGYVYSVSTEQITEVTNTFIADSTWLPDSEHFLFIGPRNCEDCRAGSDLYIGDRNGIHQRRLTDLESLSEGMDRNGGLFRTQFSRWSPIDERIYFILWQSNMEGVMMLYSMDEAGDIRFKADLNAIYETHLPLSLINMWIAPDGSINIIAEAQSPTPEVEWRWSFLRYTPTDGIEIMYERDFLAMEDWRAAVRAIRYVETVNPSVDREYVAIAGNNISEDDGLIVVLDKNGNVVYEEVTHTQTCDTTWLDNHTLAYIEMTEGSRCRYPSFIEFQPAIKIVSVNLVTGDVQTIVEAEDSPVYLAPNTDFVPYVPE